MVTEEFPKVTELKERYDFERHASWAAEESLAWVIAVDTGWLVQVYSHRWWLAVVVGFCCVLSGRPILRQEAAEDAYYRAAGLGRYATRRSDQLGPAVRRKLPSGARGSHGDDRGER